MFYGKYNFFALCLCFIISIFILLNESLVNKYNNINIVDVPTEDISVDETSTSVNIPVPSSSANSKNIYKYNKNLYIKKQQEYADVILPYNECKTDGYLSQTLFIGDSNTDGLSTFGYMPLQNVLGKKSMGIQGVKTNQFVWFTEYNQPLTIVKAVSVLKPRRVIINFGTNNSVGTDIKDFISVYKSAVSAIEASYPYCDIIIAAVLPVGEHRENTKIRMETIDSFNLALMQMCREKGYKFLNYPDVFKNKDTGYMEKTYVADDGIHLNHEGFTILLEYIDNHQYNTIDRRPPVGYIPHRIDEPIIQSSSLVEEIVPIPNNEINSGVTSDTNSHSENSSLSESLSKNQSITENISSSSEKIIYDPFS